MSAPTAISVEVDREEYSRFESDRDSITVTVTPSGTDLYNEQIYVQLRKARRARDEIVATKILTLSSSLALPYAIEFDLTSIVDEHDVPKVRRGSYFIQAYSSTNPSIEGVSGDFNISLITTDKFKSLYLHGVNLRSTEVLSVVDQPQLITGVTVESVSPKHPQSAFPLSYNYVINQLPSVTGVETEPFALTNLMTLSVRLDGADPVTVTFHAVDFVDITNATVDEVVAVINNAAVGLTATESSGALQLTGGNYALVVDPVGTATTALGLTGLSSLPSVTRTLSWCNGPIVVLEPSKKTYVLRRTAGYGSTDYIQVRVSSFALLPTQSHAEDLVISQKAMDDSNLRQIINKSISWVEDVALSVYLEPTRLVTEVDPDAIAYPSGEDIPELVGATWDEVVDALEYTVPAPGHFMAFKCPYQPVQYFNELYGKLANVRIVDVALEWVEPHKATGWVELVPFAQEVAFNYLGLVWVQSIRGPIPLPNFWNFDLLVGYAKTPDVLIELVAKKSAIDALTLAGQAFHPGLGSQSVSRDGVSESVSYTAAMQGGIFGAAIRTYQDWIDQNLTMLRGAFRGPSLVVL